MSTDTISGNGSGDDSPHNAYRVTLPEFEGPLDLLLHLCQTHELDILNISISFVAEKYIEYLELMQNMSVEVAADYLVMAAHLAYLKSRELVPSPEPLEVSEDGEELLDPREELIRRLLQYQKYKHAAEDLGGRPIEGRNVFLRGMTLEGAGEAGLAEHSVWKLLEHWAQILEKAKPQHTHDVVVDRVSIADRVNHIVDMLEAGKGMVRFEDLVGQNLTEPEQRHQIVVSLLAVLELARLRVIRILHQEETGTFFLAQVEGAGLADARNLRVTSVKEEHDQSPAEEPAAAAPAREEPAAEIPAVEASAEEVPAVEVAAEAVPVVDEPVVDEPTAEIPAVEVSAVVEPASEAPATPIPAVETPVADVPEPAEINAKSEESPPAVGDLVRQPCQDDVISVPSSAFAETGEQATDGQTQEEQDTTTK